MVAALDEKVAGTEEPFYFHSTIRTGLDAYFFLGGDVGGDRLCRGDDLRALPLGDELGEALGRAFLGIGGDDGDKPRGCFLFHQ